MRFLSSRIWFSLAVALVSAVFLVVGFWQFGFWDNGPTAAFFPICMSMVLLVASCVYILQAMQHTEKTIYTKEEWMIVGAVMGILCSTWLIGLIPSLFLFVWLWLRLVEHTSIKVMGILTGVLALLVGVFVFWLQVQFPMGLLGQMIGG